MVNIVTYIWQDFANEVSSTYEFRRSCERFGYALTNVATEKHHVGNAAVLRLLSNQYAQMSGPTVYADGADSFFVQPITVPENSILYSTEKAIWPPTTQMREAWSDHPAQTPWCYLNGGGYCGPAELISEFFTKYVMPRIDSVTDDAHSQGVQAFAYIDAIRDGFPIALDSLCVEFQTIGFTNEGDFRVQGQTIYNQLTGSMPALFHGNGRTPMGWVYETMPPYSV